MTNGEKLGYDSDKLKKSFEEFIHIWPDKHDTDCTGCVSHYDALRDDYDKYN